MALDRKSFIQPLDSCCCAASLDFGIKLILVCHSMVCFMYVYTCFSNIVLEYPTLGSGVALVTQSFNCAWGLATIPFIGFGISGVRNHCEIHLRIYMMWLILTVFMDLFFTGIYLSKTLCANMPAFLVEEGGAFACGSMRLMGIVFLLTMFSCALYAVFVVWSRCEELQDGGSEPAFESLVDATLASKKRAIYEHKSGLFGTGPILPKHGNPIMYNSLASPPFAGSARIFSGTEHTTDFPPPPMRFHG